MTRQQTKPENRTVDRVFSSPIALAYVRIAQARGQTLAEARQRYLNYLRRAAASASSRRTRAHA